MLVFEVNGKKEKCPSCWEEAKIKHFQQIMRECVDGDNPIKVFSILTGTNYDALEESTSEDLDAAIYQATAFAFHQKQDFREVAMPDTITLRGKTVKIPKKVSSLSIGQNFQLRSALATAKNIESLISLACAVYLQPLVDESKFDFEKAKELESEILEMNLYDVFPIGFFWLSKLNNYGSSGLLTSLLNLLKRIDTILLWPSKRMSHALTLFMTLALLINTPKLTDNYRDLCNTNPLMSSCLSFFYGKNSANFRTDFQDLKKL